MPAKQTLFIPKVHPMAQAPPLSLYIHVPWCIHKCPYCDFNSHERRQPIDEQVFLTALLDDLALALPNIWGRPIVSIFIGGGTPSLLSDRFYDQLLSQLRALLPLSADLEITMEANPGTVDQAFFKGYQAAGINRLSLGIQSFSPQALQQLGRIHDDTQAYQAIELAKRYFNRINLDIMFALPKQSLEAAQLDLKTAIAQDVEHISWYQLTIEPNTYFHRYPPICPTHDDQVNIWEAGQAQLREAGYQPYEVSAYTRQAPCTHNLNYWQFGDYLGIGPGAASKLTYPNMGRIERSMRYKNPKDYLNPDKPYVMQQTIITDQERAFEFMLNALRLYAPLSKALFIERTGLSLKDIQRPIQQALQQGWLIDHQDTWQLTPLGQRFLDDVASIFLNHD